MRRALPQLFVGALALSGCNRDAPPAAPPAPSPEQVSVASVSPARGGGQTPRTQADYPTNEGELQLHNLESQIAGQDQVFAKNHDITTNGVRTSLALLHGQVTGKIADYIHAEELANAFVKAAPKNFAAWRVHASVMSTFHRFADAEHDLAQAEVTGDKKIELVAPRMGLDAARGLNDDAVFAYREKMAKELPGIDTLMALGIAQGERGDLAAATKSFVAAQDIYRDVSAFPVAFLYFQEGLIEQRSGSPARARTLFQAAHERLPQYPQATAHLASVLAATGDRDKAIALMEPLASADDPEYAGELAALYDDANDHDRGTKLRKETAVRYEALLKKYPFAFADHAARFYLSGPPAQQNGKRALALAQINMKNRATIEAQRLTIDAAIAAKDAKTACTVADALVARTHLPPEAHVSASRAYTACGKKDLADTQAAAIAAPTPAR